MVTIESEWTDTTRASQETREEALKLGRNEKSQKGNRERKVSRQRGRFVGSSVRNWVCWSAK